MKTRELVGNAFLAAILVIVQVVLFFPAELSNLYHF